LLSENYILIAVAATQAAVAAVEVVATPQRDVYDDGHMIGLCVLGSIMGAFLAVAAFKPQSDGTTADPKRMHSLSLKFGVSMVSGVAFSPLIIRNMVNDISPDIVVGISGIVALLAVTGLHKVSPMVEEYIKKRLP
jgi:hypothetical protein